MENVLITLGDSFTWGQGLDYHLRKVKYPTSFKVMKDDNSYPFPHLVSSNVVEFDEFRKKNNFSKKGNNLLSFICSKKYTSCSFSFIPISYKTTSCFFIPSELK